MSDLSYLEKSELTKSDLKRLSSKINELKQLRIEIEKIEGKLKELKTVERAISGEDIPQFLSQFSIDSLNLDDGSKVSIKEDLHVSLPKTDLKKRKHLLKWISVKGGSGIIKDTLTIQDPDEELIKTLQELGFSFERKQDINSQTLKAFFRNILGINKNTIQQIELGDIPPEANLFIFKETKIK